MDWWVDADVKVIQLTLGASGSRSVHGVGGITSEADPRTRESRFPESYQVWGGHSPSCLPRHLPLQELIGYCHY